MGTVFKDMIVKDVYFQAGSFQNSQRRKFQKAPFSLVTIPDLSSDLFLQPLIVVGSGNSNGQALNDTAFVDYVDEGTYRLGEGFQDLESIVLDGAHCLGTWQSHTDDWIGVHGFSYL